MESRKKREEKQKSLTNIRESLKRLKIEESQEIKKTKNENEKKLKLIKEELSKQNQEKIKMTKAYFQNFYSNPNWWQIAPHFYV